MKIIRILATVALSIILCLSFVLSVFDTVEKEYPISFDKEKMLLHVEKLSENGPRSIIDTEANGKALEYVISEIEKCGVTNADTTEKPAYLVQDFVATDKKGLYQDFHLKNVIVHIPANAEKSSGKAIMFMAHFDSVPTGQGSADDGVACATMLEAIRYYTDKLENGYVMENDLVFCFVNGEEYDLFGSRAFMNEFKGFDNVTERIRFATNLESRGTEGTLVLFETSKNNYNTIKLFSEINENIFTCSLATMIYDIMPNSTDFTNLKDSYQGINLANILGGENYHTQNDNPENVKNSYLSQQAQTVERLIDKLSVYDLESLYEPNGSAVFFSYLNLTTVFYSNTLAIVLAIFAIGLVAANVIISAIYRKQNNIKKTAKAIGCIVGGTLVSAGATYVCYIIFQLLASLVGAMDIHAFGKISYSSTWIAVGIVLLSISVSVFTVDSERKLSGLEGRDLTRALAYIHATLGVLLTFIAPAASYFFIFSGILLTANELLITCVKKTDLSVLHLELLATAITLPAAIPITFLAVSALGMTVSYVFGAVFALLFFGVGVAIEPLCRYLSPKALLQVIRKRQITSPSSHGAAVIAVAAAAIFLTNCLFIPNASVNLQGYQSPSDYPHDDALVCVINSNGNHEYRVYDLNAYRCLKEYAPEMKYASSGEDSYYVGQGEKPQISHSIATQAEGRSLKITKIDNNSQIRLTIHPKSADSFTVDDGVTQRTYKLEKNTPYTFNIHSDCTVTINGGSADVDYTEILRDYPSLIPGKYQHSTNPLHFNLWLTNTFTLD